MSNPGMPPAQMSNPSMSPAQRSNPGMPPANPGSPAFSPLHASMAGDPNRVDPAQYNQPMSGPVDATDPAVMELPPIDAWRKAS